jgi:GDP-L-fucose synthase
MREEHLLTGELEPTNEAYAIAKIAGLKLCQAYHRQHGCRYISLMPTNIYGPGDNFDLQTSHVLPALIRKFVEACARGDKEVTVWGSGRPRREFLHADDLADACVFLMHNYDEPQIINVGTGSDVSIAELAQLIATTTGFRGEVVYDASKPDGTPRKLLDVRRLTNLGWTASIPLEAGIRSTVEWYQQQYNLAMVASTLTH